jgi:subtilase family serine protease
LISRSRSLRVAAIAACVAAGAVPATAAAASRTALPGSAPDWAKPANQVGSVPNTQAKTFWVYLKLRNASELDQRIAALSNPADASYGKYLSADAFRARYAPTAASADAVRSYLKGAGFTVASAAPANHRWVQASGDVAKIEQAFGVQERTYRHQGRTLAAPNGDLAVASSVAGLVSGVAGLDGSDRLIQPKSHASKAAKAQDVPTADPFAPPSPAFVNAPPCSNYYGEKTATGTPPAYGRVQPYAPCGYVPSQLQGAYGLTNSIRGGLDGRGQKVGIVDAFASPTIQKDANTYASRHGQGPVNLKQYNPPGLENVPEDEPTGCDPQGWYGEETLDVEAVHAMAPGAGVVYAGGVDCNDESLIDAVNRIVDGNRAQIISNSYGDIGDSQPLAVTKAWEDTFRQAAAEGIGVYFSSGDDGDEIVDTGGIRTTDYPASDPYVTAVGGTSLGVGRSNDYQFETGWGTTNSTLTDGKWDPTPPGDYLYGGGGGTSLNFDQPSYQRGVVPDSIAQYFNKRRGRAVPDVSAVGDPQTGMLVGQTQTYSIDHPGTRYGEYRIGGTSLSSPLFAGMMALADQAAGRRHGFANPAFYANANTPAFHDILPSAFKRAVVRNDYVNGENGADGTTTKLRTLDQTGTIFTRSGYDDVTGVGSPNGAAFLQALAKKPGGGKPGKPGKPGKGKGHKPHGH